MGEKIINDQQRYINKDNFKKKVKKTVVVINKQNLKKESNFVEKVSIYERILYLYFEENIQDKTYKVYIVSKKMYDNAILGCNFLGNEEEYIGDMPIENIVEEWIYSIQKKTKVFGKIKSKKDKYVNGFTIAITLIGIILIGIGIYKLEYKKNVLEREMSTTGVVYDYSTAQLRRTFLEGYYNIYVKYTVDGKTYEGFYGKTAVKPSVGNTVVVYYDPHKPSKIINYEKISEYIFQFIFIGSILLVVGGMLVVVDIIRYIKEKA